MDIPDSPVSSSVHDFVKETWDCGQWLPLVMYITHVPHAQLGGDTMFCCFRDNFGFKIYVRRQNMTGSKLDTGVFSLPTDNVTCRLSLCGFFFILFRYVPISFCQHTSHDNGELKHIWLALCNLPQKQLF